MMNLLLGVFATAITGLAWLAVQRPGIYEKLYTPIFFTVIAVTALAIAWAVGVSYGVEATKPFVDSAKAVAAIDATSSLTPPLWAFMLVQIGSGIYLIFLHWISHLSKTDSAASSKGD